MKWLHESGIPYKNVKRIYSELEPCSLGQSNCKGEIKKAFPDADVEYSYKYKGTGGADDIPQITNSRRESISQRKKDLNKLIKE